MAEDIHSLNAGFDPADDAAWRALAEKALKGAGLSRIERKTADGLARGPLFTRSDLDAVMETGAPGAAPFVRGLTAQRDAYLPWAIRQAVGHGAPGGPARDAREVGRVAAADRVAEEVAADVRAPVAAVVAAGRERDAAPRVAGERVERGEREVRRGAAEVLGDLCPGNPFNFAST